MRPFRLAVLLLALITTPVIAQGDPTVAFVATPPVPRDSFPLYPHDRAPLQPTGLVPLPIGAISVRGWLRAMLELQAAGFHGHLTEISEFLRKDGSAWLTPDGSGTRGWEEPVYWLKGFGACAYLLRDERMLAEARGWIEAILASQKPDGWFGPDAGRTGAATRLTGRDDLWPNMIALFCLQDWFEFSGDQRVLGLMDRYFDYLRALPEDRMLLGYWPKMRGGDLLYSVLWRIQRLDPDAPGTAERSRQLIALATVVHQRTAPWQDGICNWHNVNMAQAFGEPATWWAFSGELLHRDAAYRNFDQIRDTYGQVPGGMFGGDENCRPGFSGPRQAIETCGMVEMMLSHETLVWLSGDPVWADRCEDVAFNELPAATTADLRALRYLTAPNMPLSDARSKAPGIENGGPMFLMDPHRHRCCQHNFGHGWPYLASHAWYATADRGAASVLHTASAVTVRVGDDATPVTIETDTRYPFEEELRITVRTGGKPVRFPLYLRVPGWCGAARCTFSNDESAGPFAGPGYARILRTWNDGATVRMHLPMRVTLRHWERNHGTVSVDRGPLTFSLEIGEDYRRAGGTDEWPAHEIWPTTPWNYALVLPERDPASAFEVVRRDWPADDRPFTHDNTPIRLVARGARIPEWQLDRNGLVAEVGDGPVRTTGAVDSIALIPMGAARLRIASFPVAATGDNGHVWTPPPLPLFDATASHTWQGDTAVAIADGVEPASSSDDRIPRHTFWSHRGTSEWIQATFAEPRTVDEVAVYWFDDEPQAGGCRTPRSWRLLYRTPDGSWQPVGDPSGFGIARDRFNVVTFEPVTTTALRAEVQLRPDVSAGVLEWRIGRPRD
ncbi:MAG: glycoside hydrolase family 127 protein [Planctomycetes bacterium]|nr:glycoside hydrolase family 127 protein [Planctomycetota bacterium]